MLGVLLAKSPVEIEIVGDLNEHVVNWWRCVQRNHADLARLVAQTPSSRVEFNHAQSLLKKAENNDLRRAWAMHVVLRQGLNARTDGQGTWSYKLAASPTAPWSVHRFRALAKRLENVEIVHQSAEDTLADAAEKANAMIYLDPPYYSAARRYAHNDVNVDELTQLVKAQSGAVAISGYGTEWDHLGWRRAEHATSSSIFGQSGTARTEVLWMNYAVEDDLINRIGDEEENRVAA